MSNINDIYELSYKLESAIELADSIRKDFKPSRKSGFASRIMYEDLVHSYSMLKYLLQNFDV